MNYYTLFITVKNYSGNKYETIIKASFIIFSHASVHASSSHAFFNTYA